MDEAAPVYPVMPQMAAHMQAHREAVIHELVGLEASRRREPRTNFVAHAHTYEGPITLDWEHRSDKVSAILRMGPMATMASRDAGLPHLAQRTLVLPADAVAGLPETVWTTLEGRRLGDVVSYANPFMDRLRDIRISGVLRLAATVHLHLDAPLVEWDAEAEGRHAASSSSSGR